MEVEKYINKLLQKQDCVIIPGWGGFVTQYIPAEINIITNRLSPPSKKIAFNPQLANDDNALALAIAEDNKIPEEKARDIINVFVGNLKSAIWNTGALELKDVGRFFRNSQGKIEFEQTSKINFLEDSFGLPELIFKPVERNTMKTRPAKKSAVKEEYSDVEENQNPGKRSFAFMWALIPLLVLAGVGGFIYANKNNESMKAKFPFTLIFGTQESTPLVDAKADTVEETEIVAEMSEPEELPIEEVKPEEAVYHEVAVSGSRGNYSIIVGSFNQKSNAEKLIAKIEKEGGNALLIEPDSRSNFYRVSVAEFNEKEAAFKSLGKYRSDYGNEAWVMAGK